MIDTSGLVRYYGRVVPYLNVRRRDLAKLIKTTGETMEIEPKNKKKFTLEELQGFVGGYIEPVYLPKGEVMICNEEGKIHGLEINVGATAIAYQFGLCQSIVGDVVICRKGQM
jgi:Domain of unknown function (DUF3846)